MSTKTDYNNSEPYIKEFHQDVQSMHQINEFSQSVAIEAQNALKTSLIDFETANANIKKKYEKELACREKTIKIMALAIFILSGCVIALASKVFSQR
jgi:hypothetical protein